MLTLSAVTQCDYVIKGETEKDLLKNGAEQSTQAHGINADDITMSLLTSLTYIVDIT